MAHLRRRWIAMLLLLGVIAPPSRAAADPPATAAGGASDPSGQNYAWVITNHTDVPIVFVEIPHYNADTFMTPPEWEQECTGLMIAGHDRGPGRCQAWPKNGEIGIPPGTSADFGMRIAREGAQRRPGVILVRFADSREYRITDVEVPARETTAERYVALYGMALVVGILIFVQWRAHRRRKVLQAETPAAEPRPPRSPAA